MEFSEWKEKYNGNFHKTEFHLDQTVKHFVSIKLTKEALQDLIKLEGFKEIEYYMFDTFIFIFDMFPKGVHD
jgi:hypothetical protein